MKKVFRILIAMLILGSCLLSACKEAVEPTEVEAGEEQEAAEPEAEDSEEEEEAAEAEETPSRTDLNLALEAVGATMDPHIQGLTVDQRVGFQIYEGLLFANEKTSELSPRLAEDYSISDDGLVYTFYLRDDVLFHNGDPLKASDVVFSYLRAMEAVQMEKYTNKIVDVVALDDLTVEITLTEPYYPFLYYTSMIKVINERAVTEAGELFGAIPTDSGTGAYRLVEYEPSTKIVLEAFSDYYRGEPTIKDVTFNVIVDKSTALVAFQNGEIDFLEVPVANWEEIESSGMYTTETVETGHITYLALNVGQDGPLADQLVRQAINYAIDKQAVIDIVFSGMATVADHEIKPGMYSGAPETDFVYEYNPEKARELLAEAGYPDGVDIGQIQAAPATYQMVAEVLQAQLAEVGITAEVLKGDLSAMVVDWRAGNYDALCCAYTPAFSYEYRRNRIHSTIENAFMKFWQNDDCDHEYIDNIMDTAAAELDEEVRNALYLELEEYILELGAYVPLKYSERAFAWDQTLNAETYLNLFDIYDWSWN